MNTAERLKELRESKGLSQEQLAKIIGRQNNNREI